MVRQPSTKDPKRDPILENYPYVRLLSGYLHLYLCLHLHLSLHLYKVSIGSVCGALAHRFQYVGYRV